MCDSYAHPLEKNDKREKIKKKKDCDPRWLVGQLATVKSVNINTSRLETKTIKTFNKFSYIYSKEYLFIDINNNVGQIYFHIFFPLIVVVVMPKKARKKNWPPLFPKWHIRQICHICVESVDFKFLLPSEIETGFESVDFKSPQSQIVADVHQIVANWFKMLQIDAKCCKMLQNVAKCCKMLQNVLKCSKMF